jgi:cholesterol transport system auxiliary component
VRSLWALLATGLCSGCTGSVLTSANEAPDVYRLEAPTLAAGGDELPLALVVSRPRAVSSLDTDRIAVVRPGGSFDYFAGMRWADPAPQMLQGLLVQAIDADGRFAAVVAAPSRVPTDMLLDIELRRFEAVYGAGAGAPRIRVELQANLVDVRKGQRVASFAAASEADASGDHRRSVIAAFDRATAEAVRAVVARVRESGPMTAR